MFVCVFPCQRKKRLKEGIAIFIHLLAGKCYHMCPNKVCITKASVCDGVIDCKDRSDELNCTRSCECLRQTHIPTRIYTHTQTYTPTHRDIHTHIYTHTHTQATHHTTYSYTHHTHIHTPTHRHTHTHTDIHRDK